MTRRKMYEISVVMVVYNAKMYVIDAIESVLKQSFDNFEFIIVDDGSIDETCSIIKSFGDKRIKIIQNKHDYIESLNIALNNANGKYIACMDATDIMHIDRLKIQYSIMENEADITVCGTGAILFSPNLQTERMQTPAGLIKRPLLKFIQGNFLFHPTVMIRTKFLRKHRLKYKNYPHSEDFKFWTEIAKSGGQFYVDNQTLLFLRIFDTPIDKQKSEVQKNMTNTIINEVLDFLIAQNKKDYPELSELLKCLCILRDKGLIDKTEIPVFFQRLFSNNDIKLIL